MKDKFSEQDGCRFSNILKLSQTLSYLEHPQQMLQKKKKKSYFDTPKTYFIILSHQFIISYLSDVLSFNSIY